MDDESHMSHSSLRHVVEVTDWRPEGVLRCLAVSPRNFVGLLDDQCSVLKYPLCKSRDAMDALYEEAARYQAIGSHENLVVFKGIHEHGLVFEFCEKGNLEEVIRSSPGLNSTEKRQISKQITRCLIHLHNCNYIHCDLNVRNIFITSALVARVGDIQGQLHRADGTVDMPTMSEENVKSRHPHAGEDEFTPRTDIFALGTLLYHLWHEHPPFEELDENQDQDKIQARYRVGDFPIDPRYADGIDKIISNCWKSEYKQAVEVLQDMDDLEMHVTNQGSLSSLRVLLQRATAWVHGGCCWSCE